MAERLELGSQFVVRMAGFPVELIRSLSSPVLGKAIDAWFAAEDALAESQRALTSELKVRGAAVRRIRQRVRRGRPIEVTVDEDLRPLVEHYHRCRDHLEETRQEAHRRYDEERAATREKLAETVDDRFRRVLLLSSKAKARNRLLGPRKITTRRDDEATFIAYLQRLTTKNDTISFFGPTAWGTVVRDSDRAIDLQPEPSLEGCVWFERWAADALVRQLEEDPAVSGYLRPTLPDDLMVLKGSARRLSSGEDEPLSSDMVEMLERVDQHETVDALRRAHGEAMVDEARERNLIESRLPLGASPWPLASLQQIVDGWPDGEAKQRWAATLSEFEARRADVETNTALNDRRRALDALDATLVAAGVDTARDSRALGANRLPVTEDCRIEMTSCQIGRPLIDRIEEDLGPWFELWRDLAGTYGAALLELLSDVWRSCDAPDGVPLPLFLQAARAARINLDAAGGIGVPAALEARIQDAWHEQLGERLNEPAVQLTTEDLGFLRKKFPIRRIRGFGFPAPDIQIRAATQDAINDGQWDLVLGEIHPMLSLWHNVFFHWCPDPEALVDDYRACDLPPVLEYAKTSHFLGPVHTMIRAPQPLGRWTSTGPIHIAGVPHIRSAELTVHLEDDDLLVRDGDGEVRGSLIDNWLVPLSTHGLELLGTGDHTPRLLVGRAIVQRRTWTVATDPIIGDARSELDVMVALRKLQREVGFPNELFVRPILPTRVTRHQDRKPIFIDLENPTLVAWFHSKMKRYRQFRLVEALPATDEFWLNDDRGHYSCELRFMTRPRRDES